MHIRAAALSAAVALASIGSVLAQTTEPRLVATGTVVSTGNTSMVVKIDDHGHPIPFVISTTTLLPAGLEVGSRVKVVYHPIGTTGQMADTVALLEAPRASAAPEATTSQADTTRAREPEPDVAQRPSREARAAQLPATASALPLLGLIGLVALAGSVSLRAIERRRSRAE